MYFDQHVMQNRASSYSLFHMKIIQSVLRNSTYDIGL